MSPYNYTLNCPVNAIDPDGSLVVFVNGFMINDWLKSDNRKSITKYDQGLGGYYSFINPSYSLCPPSKEFTKSFPQNNGQSFDYWGDIDDLIMSGLNDYNSMYVNATSWNILQAEDRYSGGRTAAYELIRKLNNGSISLADDETIKVVGHSQGAAFAAGTLSVLAGSGYASRVALGMYLAPHQPGSFLHPSNVYGVQWSTESDWVASRDWRLLGLNGGSHLAMINGVSTMYTRKNYKGGRGGHSVDTYLDDLANYFRSFGITVNVID